MWWLEKEQRVFVFGSNLAGRHGAGSALHALKYYGAIYGQGEGWQGESYAIPTKDREMKRLSAPEIYKGVRKFVKFARKHPEMTFLVVEVGCGLAGYDPECVAPMFHDCPDNCRLPPRFKEVLEKGVLMKMSEYGQNRVIPSDSPERKR